MILFNLKQLSKITYFTSKEMKHFFYHVVQYKAEKRENLDKSLNQTVILVGGSWSTRREPTTALG